MSTRAIQFLAEASARRSIHSINLGVSPALKRLPKTGGKRRRPVCSKPRGEVVFIVGGFSRRSVVKEVKESDLVNRYVIDT